MFPIFHGIIEYLTSIDGSYCPLSTSGMDTITFVPFTLGSNYCPLSTTGMDNLAFDPT